MDKKFRTRTLVYLDKEPYRRLREILQSDGYTFSGWLRASIDKFLLDRELGANEMGKHRQYRHI